jgi:hypothetical protein
MSYARERNLKLKFENPNNYKEVYVYADTVRTHEVIDNYVSNALKYTMKGGVTVRIDENAEDGNMVKISVSDTGIGIPKEDIDKLGRKFFRARQFIEENQEHDTDIKVSGTGLGLYVSFELVKLMGGKNEVKSEVGKGSTFSVYLPKYKGQPEKMIDQTFSEEEEFDDKILDRIKQQQHELMKEHKEEVEADDQDKKEKSKHDNYTDYTRLTSANDIISKINTGRKYLETKAEDEQSSGNIGKEQHEVDPETEENEENRPTS